MGSPFASRLGAEEPSKMPHTSRPRRCRSAGRKSCKTRLQDLRETIPCHLEGSIRMILTTTCLIVLATHMVNGQSQVQDSLLVQQDNVGSLLQQAPPAGSIQQPSQQPQRPKQVEYLVRPNSPARIECKLPPLLSQSNKNRTIYWNFHGTTTQNPRLLCYAENCIGGTEHGVEIDFDQTSGTYDLVINNSTYELNDGVYYCDFQDKSPGSRFVREYRLTILLEPQQPSISASSASAREGQEYQLSCQSSGGNPEPNITWFKNGLQLLSGQGLRVEQTRVNGTTTSVLTWIPTIDDHEAVYRCDVANKAMGERSPLTQAVTLSVEYAPRISVGPFNPLKVMQGERTTISCQVDANPPVKSIRWFRDGHQVFISNQFNHTIHEVKISDASVYSCQADNGIAPFLLGPANSLVAAQAGATGSGVFSFLGLASSSNDHSKTLVEARLQLEVLYAPRVQIRDPEARTQAHNENDPLSLNCSVDSWPPAHEFVWTKADDENWRRTGPMLDFQALTANDMGNYTCTASNRLEPSGSGGIVSERQGSASFSVLVNHRPGLAEIIVGRNGETELGNKTLIQCRAKPPGFPETKYTFWKVGVKNQKLPLTRTPVLDPVYTILSARADDESRYACVAQNKLGQSNEAFADLAVNESPMIVDEQTWHDSDQRHPGDYPYAITVRATGKPEPRVSWFHRSPVDGRRIELSSAEMQARFQIDTRNTSEHLSMSRVGHPLSAKARSTLVSTLTFKTPLEVDDRGLYSVEFFNGLSRVAVQNLQLHIDHAPIPAIKNMPVIYQPADSSVRGSPANSKVAASTRAGFNIGETVLLTCRVSAYPKPSFTWVYQSSLGAEPKMMLQNDNRYQVELVNVLDDIWESRLSFNLESDSDYGDYMCVSANPTTTGVISENTNIVIHLDRKSVPEPPVQVDQIDAAQDSVTLQWFPGFDGGFAQNTFIVQYAPEDSSGLSLMRRFGPSIDDQLLQSMSEPQSEQAWPKLYYCLSLNPCTIDNLQPRQAYLMRIRARNELGISRDFSDEVRVSTRANITQIPRIQEAYFDSAKNILKFRVEPNPEYLLNNLVARIDARGSNTLAWSASSNSLESSSGTEGSDQLPSEWRRFLNVPVRHEQGEAYLDMDPKTEQIRLTLCSRLNETLCGAEFVMSTQGAVASFMRDQHGFTISILASTLILILVISGTATTLYSCCHSRKAKKAAALDGVDVNGHLPDNKALGGHVNGGLTLNNGTNGVSGKVGSHSFTASTNSTSANGQLQSIESINNGHLNHINGGGGSTSDHSSDHSRQAKLDSMLPPNYSHYADRASLMLEQQQQQQQQQQAYMQDKLGPPFGQPNDALLYSNQLEPQIGDYFGSYDPSSAAVMSSLEQHPMDAQANSLMMNSVLSNGGQMYDPNQMADASMYSTHQQLVDEYNNYNALANHQQHDQMIESAYGTTTAPPPPQVMAQPHQASYDNNANQSYCQSYGSPYDQQQQQQLDPNGSHYQQDLAAAQQQMYGTLTRNLSAHQQVNGIGNNTDSSPSLQQQQQEQYLSGAGLMPPPPPPQESDYGTTGRNGRPIREIIV